MKPIDKEDEIFQEIFEELKKLNFNFDNCTFYQDDEGNTIYIIQNKNIPKSIKLIFEK